MWGVCCVNRSKCVKCRCEGSGRTVRDQPTFTLMADQPVRLLVGIRSAQFETKGKYWAALAVGNDSKRTDVNEEPSTSVVWKEALHAWPLTDTSAAALGKLEISISITQLLFSKGDRKVGSALIKLEELKALPIPGGKPVLLPCEVNSDGARASKIGTLKLSIEIEDAAAAARAAAEREAAEKARLEAEEKARRDAEEESRRAAEEEKRRRDEAEEKARREAEEKARREAEEAAERARLEEEETQRREAIEQEKRAIRERLQSEAEARARQREEDEARRAAAEQAKREADERARREDEERRERDAKARAAKAAEKAARRKAMEEAPRGPGDAWMARERRLREVAAERDALLKAEAARRRAELDEAAEAEAQRRRTIREALDERAASWANGQHEAVVIGAEQRTLAAGRALPLVGCASAPAVGSAKAEPLAAREHALQRPLLRPKSLGLQWTCMAYDRASCPYWQTGGGGLDASALPTTAQELSLWIRGLHAEDGG